MMLFLAGFIPALAVTLYILHLRGKIRAERRLVDQIATSRAQITKERNDALDRVRQIERLLTHDLPKGRPNVITVPAQLAAAIAENALARGGKVNVPASLVDQIVEDLEGVQRERWPDDRAQAPAERRRWIQQQIDQKSDQPLPDDPGLDASPAGRYRDQPGPSDVP